MVILKPMRGGLRTKTAAKTEQEKYESSEEKEGMALRKGMKKAAKTEQEKQKSSEEKEGMALRKGKKTAAKTEQEKYESNDEKESMALRKGKKNAAKTEQEKYESNDEKEGMALRKGKKNAAKTEQKKYESNDEKEGMALREGKKNAAKTEQEKCESSEEKGDMALRKRKTPRKMKKKIDPQDKPDLYTLSTHMSSPLDGPNPEIERIVKSAAGKPIRNATYRETGKASCVVKSSSLISPKDGAGGMYSSLSESPEDAVGMKESETSIASEMSSMGASGSQKELFLGGGDLCKNLYGALSCDTHPTCSSSASLPIDGTGVVCSSNPNSPDGETQPVSSKRKGIRKKKTTKKGNMSRESYSPEIPNLSSHLKNSPLGQKDNKGKCADSTKTMHETTNDRFQNYAYSAKSERDIAIAKMENLEEHVLESKQPCYFVQGGRMYKLEVVPQTGAGSNEAQVSSERVEENCAESAEIEEPNLRSKTSSSSESLSSGSFTTVLKGVVANLDGHCLEDINGTDSIDENKKPLNLKPTKTNWMNRYTDAGELRYSDDVDIKTEPDDILYTSDADEKMEKLGCRSISHGEDVDDEKGIKEEEEGELTSDACHVDCGDSDEDIFLSKSDEETESVVSNTGDYDPEIFPESEESGEFGTFSSDSDVVEADGCDHPLHITLLPPSLAMQYYFGTEDISDNVQWQHDDLYEEEDRSIKDIVGHATCSTLADEHNSEHATCSTLADEHDSEHATCSTLADEHNSEHATCSTLADERNSEQGGYPSLDGGHISELKPSEAGDMPQSTQVVHLQPCSSQDSPSDSPSQRVDLMDVSESPNPRKLAFQGMDDRDRLAPGGQEENHGQPLTYRSAGVISETTDIGTQNILQDERNPRQPFSSVKKHNLAPVVKDSQTVKRQVGTEVGHASEEVVLDSKRSPSRTELPVAPSSGGSDVLGRDNVELLPESLLAERDSVDCHVTHNASTPPGDKNLELGGDINSREESQPDGSSGIKPSLLETRPVQQSHQSGSCTKRDEQAPRIKQNAEALRHNTGKSSSPNPENSKGNQVLLPKKSAPERLPVIPGNFESIPGGIQNPGNSQLVTGNVQQNPRNIQLISGNVQGNHGILQHNPGNIHPMLGNRQPISGDLQVNPGSFHGGFPGNFPLIDAHSLEKRPEFQSSTTAIGSHQRPLGLKQNQNIFPSNPRRLVDSKLPPCELQQPRANKTSASTDSHGKPAGSQKLGLQTNHMASGCKLHRRGKASPLRVPVKSDLLQGKARSHVGSPTQSKPLVQFRPIQPHRVAHPNLLIPIQFNRGGSQVLLPWNTIGNTVMLQNNAILPGNVPQQVPNVRFPVVPQQNQQVPIQTNIHIQNTEPKIVPSLGNSTVVNSTGRSTDATAKLAHGVQLTNSLSSSVGFSTTNSQGKQAKGGQLLTRTPSFSSGSRSTTKENVSKTTVHVVPLASSVPVSHTPIPANGSSVSVNATPLSANAMQGPASALSVPANATPILANAPHVPANLPLVPANATTVPAKYPPVPAIAPPFPASGTQVPANTQPFPANTSLVPANATPILANAPHVPANLPLVPANATTVPAKYPPFPANGTQIPANTQPFPANTSLVPANATPILANAPHVPANLPLVPANATTVPAKYPPVPPIAPVPANTQPVPANASWVPANASLVPVPVPANGLSIPANATPVPANAPLVPINATISKDQKSSLSKALMRQRIAEGIYDALEGSLSAGSLSEGPGMSGTSAASSSSQSEKGLVLPTQSMPISTSAPPGPPKTQPTRELPGEDATTSGEILPKQNQIQGRQGEASQRDMQLEVEDKLPSAQRFTSKNCENELDASKNTNESDSIVPQPPSGQHKKTSDRRHNYTGNDDIDVNCETSKSSQTQTIGITHDGHKNLWTAPGMEVGAQKQSASTFYCLSLQDDGTMLMKRAAGNFSVQRGDINVRSGNAIEDSALRPSRSLTLMTSGALSDIPNNVYDQGNLITEQVRAVMSPSSFMSNPSSTLKSCSASCQQTCCSDREVEKCEKGGNRYVRQKRISREKRPLSALEKRREIGLRGLVRRIPTVGFKVKYIYWRDLKEVVFPKCSRNTCGEVIQAIKNVARREDLKCLWLIPCHKKHSQQFAKQFRAVDEGELLARLELVLEFVLDLQTAVMLIHRQRGRIQEPEDQCQFTREYLQRQEEEKQKRAALVKEEQISKNSPQPSWEQSALLRDGHPSQTHGGIGKSVSNNECFSHQVATDDESQTRKLFVQSAKLASPSERRIAGSEESQLTSTTRVHAKEDNDLNSDENGLKTDENGLKTDGNGLKATVKEDDSAKSQERIQAINDQLLVISQMFGGSEYLTSPMQELAIFFPTKKQELVALASYFMERNREDSAGVRLCPVMDARSLVRCKAKIKDIQQGKNKQKQAPT